MDYAYLALHLLPTLAVVVLAWIIARAVSVRVTWRRSTVHRLDGEAGPTPMPETGRFDAPRDGRRSARPPAASRPHAA
jgi:hypothetical protein